MLIPLHIVPKQQPSEWSDLHEAATAILEREVTLGPDEFLKWLEARPGAAVIYLMLAEGAGIEAEIKRQAMAETSPDRGSPATIAELVDEHGRIPRTNWSAPPTDIGPSIAEDQWRTMSALRHAAAHPKNGA